MNIFLLIFFIFIPNVFAEFVLKKFTENENSRHYFYIQNPEVKDQKLREHFKIFNPFAFYEGATIKDILVDKVSNQPIYDAVYRIGSFGIRKFQENESFKKWPHLIVAGDSDVFGIGNRDEDLFTYKLQNLRKKNYVINLGFPGSFLNHLLYFQENVGIDKMLKKESANLKGIFIYQVQYFLLERLIGSKEFVKWGADSPYYKLVDGELVYQGQFNQRFLTKIYQWISSVRILDKLIKNFPRITQDEIRLSIYFLEKIEKNYHLQTLKENKFYVLLNPKGFNNEEVGLWNEMLKIFKESRLNLLILDFSEKQNLKTFNSDQHFNPIAHQYLAQRIDQLLDK